MSDKIFLVNDTDEEIEIAQVLIVGRGSDAGLVIADDQISRKHARLEPCADRLLVEDLGSINGTYLNGQREQCFEARNNDVIGFFKHNYRVQIVRPEAADADATVIYIEENAPSQQPAQQHRNCDTETTDPAQPMPDEAVADKVDVAWWEVSDVGPQKTVLLGNGQLQNTPEMAILIDAGPAEQPRLLGLNKAVAGREIPLDKGKHIVGRDAESCDIVIDDESVSSKHVQIIHDGSVWKIVDLLSSNRTRVNGELARTAYLKSGDEISLGSLLFIFQLPEQQKSSRWSKQPGQQSGSHFGLPLTILFTVIGFIAVLSVAAVLGILNDWSVYLH